MSERNGVDVNRLVLRCDSCRHQHWSAATMDDPYPHVWCGKGHWEGAPKSDITEDPWEDCQDFHPQNSPVLARSDEGAES